MAPAAIPIRDRFWSKVRKTDTCWLWISNTHWDGYGQIAESRQQGRRQRWVRAHRVAWELTHGAIPKGLLVLHRCDVRACVNPDHLFLGTQLDNIADAVRKGRHNRRVPPTRAFNGRFVASPRQSQRKAS